MHPRLLATIGSAALAGTVVLAGCGGDGGLDEAGIERCATALVPYADRVAAGDTSATPPECADLNANELSESIARMYRKQAAAAG